MNGFRDAHISIRARKLYSKKTWRWPGFGLNIKNGKFYVIQSQNTTILANNSELISCDGLSPRELMYNNIFSFYGNPNLRSNWIINVNKLLMDTQNPWINNPKSCVFKLASKQHTLSLHYSPLPKSQQAPSYWPDSASYSLPNNDTVWVSIPSFEPTTTKQVNAMTNITETFSQMAP